LLKFGTDGVRGVANVDLTPELVVALGRAAARVLGGRRFVVGRDTRISGPMIEAALCAGLASEGVQVMSLGVAPTPEIAWLSAAEGVPAAVISASHNPFSDNGIKLFAAGGIKLDDAIEAELEAQLHRLIGDEAELHRLVRHEATPEPHTGDSVGSVVPATAGHSRYAHAVESSIEGRTLSGLSVVIDCANGAASAVAPDVLRALGAKVEVIHAEPDGTNINAGCGSTHPADLQRAVLAAGADVGFAFDGDADRVVAVDASGGLVDGDQLIAMCAIDLHARDALIGGAVVVTVMANLGFRLGMAERGIKVIETPVGDRNVLEALSAGGYVLGGEQSGHIIFRNLATTGDGLLTAVQVLDLVARSGRPMAQLAADAMTKLPQVLRNVRVSRRDSDLVALMEDEVNAVEAELGDHGRVLIRASGTEPLVRVMVEAPTSEQAAVAADRLADVVSRLAGDPTS
jgi:phosphoglucosamine mutase